MNLTKSWIPPAEAANYSLFSSCSSMYWSRARFPWGRVISEQHCGFQAVTVLPLMAAQWPGFCLGLGGQLGMGTLLLQQLLVSPVWFPCTWATLSLVTSVLLPGDGIWPQTPVGNTRSSLSCATPTTSLHLGLLQLSASSLTIVFGKVLSYGEGRSGNCTQMGANSWCFNKTLLSVSLGESGWFVLIPYLPFLHQCRFWSSFGQLFVTWLFTKRFFKWSSGMNRHLFLLWVLPSAQCKLLPKSIAGLKCSIRTSQSSLHILCQVHLLPLSGISSSFHCSCLQNSSLCRQQEKKNRGKKYFTNSYCWGILV